MATFCKSLSGFLVYLKLVNIWSHACTGGMDPAFDPNRPYYNTINGPWPRPVAHYQAQALIMPTPPALLNQRSATHISTETSPTAINAITTKPGVVRNVKIIKKTNETSNNNNSENDSNEDSSFESVGQKIVNAKNQAADHIQSIGSSLDNVPKNVADAAEEAASSLSNTLKESGKAMLEKLKEIQFPEKLQPLADFAKKIFSESGTEKTHWDEVSFFNKA